MEFFSLLEGKEGQYQLLPHHRVLLEGYTPRKHLCHLGWQVSNQQASHPSLEGIPASNPQKSS